MTPSLELDKYIQSSIEVATQKANFMMQDFSLYLKRKNLNYLSLLLATLRSKKIEPIVLLKTDFLPKVPNSVTSKFSEVLKKHQYRIKDEILDCISSICAADNPVEMINIWKRFPWIIDITFDDKTMMYKIYSSEGEYCFQSTKLKYSKEIEWIKKMKKDMMPSTNKYENYGEYNADDPDNLDYSCHFTSYCMAMIYPELYATTSVCPHGFPNCYWYHSYNISEDLKWVIDISNGFIMPIEDYEKLVEPFVLDQVQGQDLKMEIDHISEANNKYYKKGDMPNAYLKILAFDKYDKRSEDQRLKLKI